MGLRYSGKGVLKAINNINTTINTLLCGQDAFDQRLIDEIMIKADGTEKVFRANAILAVSLSVAKAAANAAKSHFMLICKFEWYHWRVPCLFQ